MAISRWRSRKAAAGTLLACAGFAFSTAGLGGTCNPASGSDPCQILWDQFGIPHIYAPDLLSVVKGLGYAEMENEAETLLMNVAQARGRSAEYFGAGAGNANVASDIAVHTEGIPRRAQQWIDNGGDRQRAIIEAFAAGVNEYAAKHGDTIDPVFLRVLPFVPTDVTAGEQNTVHFTFIPEQDNIPALIAAWKSGGLPAARALARSFTPGGSNGWAIAPKKSATGNAILMGNPHLPWGNNAPIPGPWPLSVDGVQSSHWRSEPSDPQCHRGDLHGFALPGYRLQR